MNIHFFKTLYAILEQQIDRKRAYNTYRGWTTWWSKTLPMHPIYAPYLHPLIFLLPSSGNATPILPLINFARDI